jgi:uncharacterized protein (TIGR00661 family)
MKRKRVVVAPLDWGLGHATRCIPIINELLKKDCEVWMASSGSALDLLKKEFPSLQFMELVSYRATYSRILPFMVNVFFQLPKFLRAIKKEHEQLDECISQNQIDLVISDNRYGCWTKKTPCVFITHQLNIIMPFWLKWTQSLVNIQNHRFIKRFTRCWIPDIEGTHNFTGKLSYTNSLLVKSIGILSRFKKDSETTSAKHEIAVILSGLEPQRSVLEEIIKPQLANRNTAILVKGVVEDEQEWTAEENLDIVNFLTSDELQYLIKSSDIIIARSGYSTIMDLAALGRNAILVPTPGQTEQEYLANRLMKEGICFSMSQQNFDLNFAIEQSKGFKGFSNIDTSSGLLNNALDEALSL